MTLCEILFLIVNAELIDPSWSTELIFDFELDKEYVDEALDNEEPQKYLHSSIYEMGFETYNPVLNLGGVYVFFVWILFMQTIFFALKNCL